MREMYTVSDISEELRVHPKTVLRWIASGQLKGTMVSKKKGYIIEQRDYESFLLGNPVYRHRFTAEDQKNQALQALGNDIQERIKKIHGKFLEENHDAKYTDGWIDAMMAFREAVARAVREEIRV